jgi:hypothetical protein
MVALLEFCKCVKGVAKETKDYHGYSTYDDNVNIKID